MDIAKLGREETWAINGSQQFHYESLCSLCGIMIDLAKSCWLLAGRREP